MKIIKLKKNINLPQSVIALGFFDGVHLGHRKVIETAVNYSKMLGIKSLVFTFKNRPAGKLFNNQNLISKFEDKINLIKELGVDCLAWADFDDKFSKISPYDFVKKILVDIFHVKVVVVGYNYHFGHKAGGSASYLIKLSERFGFKADVIPPFKKKNEIVSSTRVRKLINSGNLSKANEFLDRIFSIEGSVIKGKRFGRAIKIHTANLKWPDEIVKLPSGVYAVFVKYDNKLYKGAANFGFNPTMNSRGGLLNQIPVLEIHILKFNKNIYREKLQVFFVKKIRNEIKFNKVEDLVKQIKKDIKKTRKILHGERVK